MTDAPDVIDEPETDEDTPEEVVNTADYELTEIPAVFPESLLPGFEIPTERNASVNVTAVKYNGKDGYYFVIAGNAFFLPKAEAKEFAQFIVDN